MPKKDIATRVSGYSVHLTWPNHVKNITITGTAIYSEDGARVDGIKRKRYFVNSENELAYGQDVVVNRITEELEQIERKKMLKDNEHKKIDLGNKMTKTFLDLFGDDLKEDSSIKNTIYPWVPSTQRQCVTYFFHNIIREISKVETEADFTSVEKKDLIDKLTEKALKKMRDKGDLEAAVKTAKIRMNQSDKIYSEMRYHCPELPNIDLRCDYRVRRKKTEQLKRLPINIHKSFRKLVEEAIEKEPFMARAAILMDSAGARSGEASATWQGWMDDYKEFIVVKIMAQEEGGKRIERLKTKDSYRMVVLDEWGTVNLRKCNQVIGEEKFSEAAPIIDKDLSTWIRNKLREAGCTDDYLRAAYEDMNRNPEHDANGKAIRDVAAHILRRNRASIWRNYCGYIQDELDYALGHVNAKSRHEKSNPTAFSTLRLLAMKNSRYDIDEEISISPKHRPINICSGDNNIKIIPFDEIRLRNNSKEMQELDIILTSCEAGENIIIEAPHSAENDLKGLSIDTGGERAYTYVIGSLDKSETEKEGEYEE